MFYKVSYSMRVHLFGLAVLDGFITLLYLKMQQ